MNYNENDFLIEMQATEEMMHRQGDFSINRSDNQKNHMFMFSMKKRIFFFSSPKLMYMKIKQYKDVFGGLFHLERNKYCSTFTIIIKSSLIHPSSIFIYMQANIY